MKGFDNQPVSPMQAMFDASRADHDIPPLPVSASGKPIIELSHSGLGNLLTCPRRYQLNKRFAAPDFEWDTGLPAVGGQAIHEYLQAKAIGASDDEATIAFFYAYDFNVEAQDSDKNRRERALEACLYSAQHAAELLAFDPAEVAQINVNGELRPAIETKFNLVIAHDSFQFEYHYRGAIDLVRYRLFGNQFIASDFKTHRNYRDGGDDNMEHKYKWDDQLIPYGLVIQHLQGGEFSAFQNTYYSLFVDINEPILKEYSFHRTREDVDRWVKKMLLIIGQIEQYGNDETWPRTGRGCDFFNNRCKFYKHCHLEDHDILQDALLGDHAPKPYKPYPAWVTVQMELS